MSLITNKKAGFNYEILEKYSAGIELFGFEVKSLKNSQGSLEGTYVTVRGGEAYIIGMFIPPYQVKNTPKDYDPYRNRRLSEGAIGLHQHAHGHVGDGAIGTALAGLQPVGLRESPLKT